MDPRNANARGKGPGGGSSIRWTQYKHAIPLPKVQHNFAIFPTRRNKRCTENDKLSRTGFQEARSLGIDTVAKMLHLEEQASVGGRPTWPCPACGAPTRHTKSCDRRGAIGVTGDGMGWRCFQCDATGDAIDFVSFALTGASYQNTPSRDEVRDWLASVAPVPPHRPMVRAPQRPRYPPTSDVAAFWKASRPLYGDAAEYLMGRKVDVDLVRDADLARSLSGDAPQWCRGPHGPWGRTGHRLVVPLFDATGVIRSVLARRVVDGDGPKSLAPAGYSRTGLVLADGLARQVLEAGTVPPWFDDDTELEKIVIAEGEIDFLLWATAPSVLTDSGHGPAVFGIVAGSWTPDISKRIPVGARVTVATDLDDDGDKYAEMIAATLRNRNEVQRWTQRIL